MNAASWLIVTAFIMIVLLGVIAAFLLVVVWRMTDTIKKVDFSRFHQDEEKEYEEEIKNIAQAGHEQGVIQADEAKMISNIFEFGDKDARDVMRFRQKIVAIETGTSLEDAIRFMVSQHYSRYPVYEEDLDHIVGMLHFRDAVKCWLETPDRIIDDIVRKPFYVHETMDINELLTKMRTNKIHLAIVLDEFGQTAGLVAMEDILETIVGDILDEYDVEEKEIIRLSEGNSYLASGMIRLEKLEEILGITFDTEEFEILNGFLINEVGHMPEADEHIRVSFKGYTFTASEQKNKVFRQVKIEKEDEDTTYDI
ncbi:MAG: hemolysin family protein [Eubacterium sp.]|nr:hemolysin family protein [Eubacterium sp.]